MAEQDFKFDDALLMKTAREMLAKKLTETVKEVAKSREWEITTISPWPCETRGPWERIHSAAQES